MYRTPGQRTSEARQRCLYCGREVAPGAECFTCRILVPPSEGANLPPRGCARCANPFLEATALGPNDAVAHQCRACLSAFITAAAWTALIDAVLAGEAVDLSRFDAQPAGGPIDVFPLVRCSVCRYEMERGRFGAKTTLVIDVCNAHGVWLDPSELPTLVDLLRAGVQTNGRPVVAAAIEEEPDPMEALLLNELRAAELAYDMNVDLRSRQRYGSESPGERALVYLHRINNARVRLDNHRVAKLEARRQARRNGPGR